MTKVPLSERPLAFIDTETTGLVPAVHEVIEVAIVKEHPDGRLDHYQTLIRPAKIELAHPKALEINGYAADPDRWMAAPRMGEVVELITGTLRGCVLVGHNVGFDIDMLSASFRNAGWDPRLPYHKVDTVALAYEHLVPCGLESLSMDAIREFLRWDTEGSHTAMKDAKDARRLYHLCNRSGKTARFLMRWGHRMRVYKAGPKATKARR